jgi:hypothetical protein
MIRPHPKRAPCYGLVTAVCAGLFLWAPAIAGPWSASIVPTGVVPSPDDTLQITASVPYLGQYGTGRGYVYLAPGHAQLVNPVLAVEGFDIDNSMGWPELYTLLDQENVIETLRAQGYDAVVLDFTDATDYIQRNAFVFTELLQQVEDAVAPEASVAVVGASMGGLVARYGLAYLESHGTPHRVRSFISFDAPQRGANIPLGLQYWTDFFSGQSPDAAFFRDRLNTPAARQMLVYHFTSPPGSTGQADPLFAALQADLAAVGGYPRLLRRVAFSNGNGQMLDQGYGPGTQLIDYVYNSSFIVQIIGNVWAVPDGGPGTVFNGKIYVLFLQNTLRTVTVSGTKPYDDAPGGWRASMVQLDTTQVDYGDIVALQDNHCFIPTVSALDLDTQDLFYDVAGDPGLLGHTPFDAVYYAPTNEEHVHISPASAAELLIEIESGVTAAEPPGRAASAPALLSAAPNPFSAVTRIAFTLPRAGRVDLRVFDVGGREVAALASGALPAGGHAFTWDGRAGSGAVAPSGMYFIRLALDDRAVTGRVVRIANR